MGILAILLWLYTYNWIISIYFNAPSMPLKCNFLNSSTRNFYGKMIAIIHKLAIHKYYRNPGCAPYYVSWISWAILNAVHEYGIQQEQM
jgi:hypothetical protein